MSAGTGAPQDQCAALTNLNGVHTVHLPVYPIEWFHDWDENTGGDYAGAALVMVEKRVTAAYCACGKKLELNRDGKIKVVENE